jgi:hypothetical protein
MVARADDVDGVHACVGLTSSSRADGGAPSSNPMSHIFLLKKTIVVTGPTDVSIPIATVSIVVIQ